ncbi:hypothetical protein, partial [Alistipes finegoldii]|uniref:hypothetical protein n=1 Tax=Alistipes finegoldii TaxID=214856 RepID=UPI003AAA8625
TRIIQKYLCKTMFRSFVLLLGLMSVTELSANPDLSALESGMDAPTPAPQGGGEICPDRQGVG